MSAMLKIHYVVVDVSPADAAVHLDLHEVAQGQENALRLLSQFSCGGKNEDLRLSECHVGCLERTYCEHAGLSSTTLALDNHVSTMNDG